MHPEIDWVSLFVRALWDLPLLLIACAWVTLVFETADIRTIPCFIDQPRVYHSPCSCGRWWLDLLHA